MTAPALTRHRAGRRHSDLRGRCVLAKAAAEQLDHRPGRRHHRRFAGPYLGDPASALADRRRERPRPSIRPARNAASRRRRCWNSTPTAICCAPGADPAKAIEWVGREHGIEVDDTRIRLADGQRRQRQRTPEVHARRQVRHADRQDRAAQGKQRHHAARQARSKSRSTRTANELYVADGYGNRRVIVFDATIGAYKRHWGAYGKPPNDDKQAALRSEGAGIAAVRQSRALREDRQ